MNEEIAKKEAQTLSNAISKKTPLVQDEDIVMVLSTRSKLHLDAIYAHYNKITGNFLDQVYV